jgi:hypothetical protein
MCLDGRPVPQRRDWLARAYPCSKMIRPRPRRTAHPLIESRIEALWARLYDESRVTGRIQKTKAGVTYRFVTV